MAETGQHYSLQRRVTRSAQFNVEADGSAGDGGDAGGSVELAVEGAPGRAAGGLVGSAVGGAVARSGAKLK